MGDPGLVQRRVALDDLVVDPGAGVLAVAFVGRARAHDVAKRPIDLDPKPPRSHDARQPSRDVHGVERQDPPRVRRIPPNLALRRHRKPPAGIRRHQQPRGDHGRGHSTGTLNLECPRGHSRLSVPELGVARRACCSRTARDCGLSWTSSRRKRHPLARVRCFCVRCDHGMTQFLRLDSPLVTVTVECPG